MVEVMPGLVIVVVFVGALVFEASLPVPVPVPVTPATLLEGMVEWERPVDGRSERV